MSKPEDDVQLSLKKRARRRLVGAAALAVLAAVVLPMVMDTSPQSPVQDVQIRIPGQDQVPPFNSRGVAEKPAPQPPGDRTAEKPVEKSSDASVAKPAEKAAEKPAEKMPEKAAEKPAEKPAPKATEKPAEKPQEKVAEKPAAKSAASDDARRAADILAGKTADSGAKAAAAGGGDYVVLIGAFANPANVKQLQQKLGELGIKVYTEALDSPQGRKTRVRAGPFASREAADKALDRMKRIGVNGVVAAK